ncbi:MAG: TIGR02444 family protein, partial [Pseudolabrys sp.]
MPGESLNPESPSHSDCGTLQYDNEFWRFSLAVYSRAGVAEECLALQETAGADINVLLFCAWTGMQTIVLSRDDIEQALRLVVAWQ